MTLKTSSNPHARWLREMAAECKSAGNYRYANTVGNAADEIEAIAAHRDALLADRERRAVETTPNYAVFEVTDDALRDIWRMYGGDFHGPKIETGTMPEAKLLPFLRSLGARPTEKARAPEVCGCPYGNCSCAEGDESEGENLG